MSIALIVVEPKSEELARLNVPVATEEVFQRVWLHGAGQVSAQWLPLFHSGVDVAAQEFDAVARELIAFREWVEGASLELDERAAVISRIDALIGALKRIGDQAGERAKVFIG